MYAEIQMNVKGGALPERASETIMEKEDVFGSILDKDEFITMQFKPMRRPYLWRSAAVLLPFLIMGLFMLIIPVSTILSGDAPFEMFIPFIIMAALLLCFAAVYLPFALHNYKITVYAVTNKRILIRTGFIGVDYRSMDIRSINSSNVNVSLVNKLFGGGSVDFGSPTSPIVQYSGRGAQFRPFSFRDIESPYDNYKKIKELIDAVQNRKEQ